MEIMCNCNAYYDPLDLFKMISKSIKRHFKHVLY